MSWCSHQLAKTFSGLYVTTQQFLTQDSDGSTTVHDISTLSPSGILIFMYQRIT